MSERVFKKRVRLLAICLMAGLLSLVIRLMYIQVAQADELSAKAENWLVATVDIPGTRGTIYDREGQKLAFTGVAYEISVSVNEKAMKEWNETPEMYAQFLAPLVGMTEAELMEYIDPAKYANRPEADRPKAVGIGPKGAKVDSAVHDKIVAMHDQQKLRGVNTFRKDIRRYPNGNFAAHVLGYFGINDQEKKEIGLAGVESVYNDKLSGHPGTVVMYTDRNGNPLPNYEPETTKQAVDGEDLVLTIDSTIQHFVEEELDNIVNKYGPKHASIIVADPNNGEILALGNRPHYNPAEYAKAEPESLWNNWALRSFEPGSTFKSFVLTAALAEHKVDLSDTFASGQIAVDGYLIKDWNGIGFGTISYREGVYNSSNVGFVKIGQKLGKESLYEYLYDFGFQKPTGIDLPGEEQSTLFNVAKMRDVDLASTSFGQGVSVTPIQQVAAMMAIANGGKVYQPHVVKEFRDQKTGQTLREVKPKVLSEVANDEVMSTVREVMEETISVEDPSHGYIKGYHVAGKTGTAQVPKADRSGYSDSAYRLSFIGFAPADKPKFLIYVTVDQPTRNAPYMFGSYIAEPSGKAVLENALRYYQVPADPSDPGHGQQAGAAGQQQQPAKPQTPKAFVDVPDFVGTTKESAAKIAADSKLKLKSVGEGPKVTGQWPDAGTGQVPEGAEIKLYYGPEGSAEGKVKLPDLTGLSLREAIETLSLLQLKIDPAGTGYVTKQELPAGTLVPVGSPVKITLSPQQS
ncbi:stage V sporulation protein D (sporulation-specific penicillin-binding protein)/penicillin-binding protein 2B [Tumebacillus sp. BK434]|uniref:penicillin-binding transpeptidase domain-containing protein n=1 Tax=Tumebacillus sp. BK434 TaxID=2512169 RepID=UPI001042F5BA|nr:penicillin-binding transpeptidase domain-containing protein [Tumebacillus sp. BK434]TCP52921.1 stage V sporulation protein D (sporulation-specific penicillin-binding protein)/penicillin-binding protein 2B [Tumebacillus sp. BK434]